MDIENRVVDRPVFVTGADGFVGSHLVDWLVEHGADVHVFVRATSSGELNNIVHRSEAITLHRGDLRDSHSVKRALSALEPYDDSLIFHLAAQAHVGESWERPYETVDTNVVGTLNLLQRRPRPRPREVRHRGHERGVRQRQRGDGRRPRLRGGRPSPPERAVPRQSAERLRHLEARGGLP